MLVYQRIAIWNPESMNLARPQEGPLSLSQDAHVGMATASPELSQAQCLHIGTPGAVRTLGPLGPGLGMFGVFGPHELVNYSVVSSTINIHSCHS